MRKVATLCAFAAVLGMTSTASAVLLNYQIASGSVAANSDDGLIIDAEVLPTVAGTSFWLNDGQSYSFAFFKIRADETDVGPDDTVPQLISASLTFSTPDVVGTVEGETYGTSTWLWFLNLQDGRVTWDGPTTVAATDRTFSIWLSDETFSEGAYGLNEDWKHGATVWATIKQRSSTASVPDAASTLILLGAAVVGLHFGRRRLSR